MKIFSLHTISHLYIVNKIEGLIHWKILLYLKRKDNFPQKDLFKAYNTIEEEN